MIALRATTGGVLRTNPSATPLNSYQNNYIRHQIVRFNISDLSYAGSSSGSSHVYELNFAIVASFCLKLVCPLIFIKGR